MLNFLIESLYILEDWVGQDCNIGVLIFGCKTVYFHSVSLLVGYAVYLYWVGQTVNPTWILETNSLPMLNFNMKYRERKSNSRAIDLVSAILEFI